MKTINERLLKVSSITQQRAMIHIYNILKETNTVVMEQLVKESGISKGVFFPVIDLLEVIGVISTCNRGCKGVFIEVIDNDNFEQIINKIKEAGIHKLSLL